MQREMSARKNYGLTVVGKDTEVPLKEISVNLTIRGFTANVVSTLKYLNTETNPIEAVFVFPLDDQSAVYQFEAQIEDRIIVAECQEKKQAQETYNDAISAGRTAVLLEEGDTASDIFRCLVGNLPPATEAIIKFAYVIELSLTPTGAVRFVLPTQLNPRYNPPVADGGTTIKPPSVQYATSTPRQPYSFTFQATVINSVKIASIIPTGTDELDVTISADGFQAEAKLSKEFVADHDLSLEVKYEQEFTPHVIIEKGDPQKHGILSRDVLMLNFLPQLNESEFSSKHEFIFIIDRSGSMGGARIESAKNALLVFLKSLPPGCNFNIIGFGSHFDMLFPEGSREYSEASLKQATVYQSALRGDFGGTEILRTLQAVYDTSPLPTHTRQIMLLTDGEVGNTEQVIDLVKRNASNTRVFAFGIGQGASTSLIKGVARASRGQAEFVLDNKDTTAQVMKTLKAAMQETVTDLQLDWQLGGSPKLVQVPRQLPPLFAGDRLIVYAINSGEQTVLEGRVELKGKIGERVVQFTLNIDSSKDSIPADDVLPVHRLAAKAEINHLQDSEKDSSNNKTEIILLSTAVNIVSRHTSMIGVDKESKQTVTGEMIQRDVPLVCEMRLSRRMRCCKRRSGHSTKSASLEEDLGGMTERRCATSAAVTTRQSRGCLIPLGLQPKCASIRRPSAGISDHGVPAELDLPPIVTSRRCQRRCEDALVYECVAGETLGEVNVDGVMAEMSHTLASKPSTVAPRGPRLIPCGMGPAPIKPAISSTPSRTAAYDPVPAPLSYMSVVELQTFDGSWKLDDQLAQQAGVTLQTLLDKNPMKSAADVWATVLALAILAIKFSNVKCEWEMIEVKAKKWLTGHDLEGRSVDELLTLATGILR